MPRLRRPNRFGEIAPRLWQGPMPLGERDVALLQQAGITRVLNLCEDAEYEPGERELLERAYDQAGITEARLPSLDHGNLLPGLVERAVRDVNGWREAGESVLVHCFAGQERSAAVAAAVVADETGDGPAAALRQVRKARRVARPLGHQVADLDRWWAARARRDEAAAELDV